MSEPRRPAPEARWFDRMRARPKEIRERLLTRREIAKAAPPLGETEIGIGPSSDGESSLLFTAMIVVGAAALALGALWVWQSWSQRSDEPIDDLLPVLAVGEDDATDELGAANPTASPPPSGADTQVGGPDLVPVTEIESPTPAQVLVVHVSGAVVLPGVVQLPAGSRVFEAVELAGGASADADVDRVNLAAPLVDGERIHVPVSGEEVPPALVQPDRPAPAPLAGESTLTDEPQMVDLNLASEAELQALPGIGPATAAAIVRTRDQRGPFLEIDELLEVPGIGDAKLVQLRPYVQVQPGR